MGQTWTQLCWYNYGKTRFTKSGYQKAKQSGSLVLPSDLTGKVFVVTGANSGLGRDCAEWLVGCNAEVYLVCRSRERGLEACEDITRKKQGRGAARLIVADCGLKSGIDTIARELAGQPRIDGLLCNAGALLTQREETSEGKEVTYATHLLHGTYTLAMALLPQLRGSAEARVVAVSSGGMYQTKAHVEDLEMRDNYDGVKQYCRMKRAQVLLVGELARLYPDITFVSCHPGWASTPGVDKSIPEFRKWVGNEFRTSWEGAEGLCRLLTVPRAQLKSGEFYLDGAIAPKYLPSGGGSTVNSPAEIEELLNRLKH
eukprot:TRINITY_DN69951_c0_g1_i1.p1 TRINITY_DN69951_c0_g1~~TRINITY_DN69951_c0_g1_i1.p1  ORF type:complete len:322 (-),score=55.99 TRINITY_DN69951_c0_g1_i1:58-999(-)